jgi:hypothetical protein
MKYKLQNPSSSFLYAASLLIFFFLAHCQSPSEIEKWGLAYQKNKDFNSLQQVVNLLPPDADTALVKMLLGEPIDMGFDYRYLIDSVGANNCTIGAVFHIDDHGKIDQKWVDEICE